MTQQLQKEISDRMKELIDEVFKGLTKEEKEKFILSDLESHDIEIDYSMPYDKTRLIYEEEAKEKWQKERIEEED